MLKERTIDVVFTLDSKMSFSGGREKVISSPLDINCNIKKLGSPSNDQAMIKIKNMLLEDMELLTLLRFKPLSILNNKVDIYAGYNGVRTLVFTGDIIKGSSILGSAPDTEYICSAQTGVYQSNKRSPILQIDGVSTVDNIFRKLCQEAGLSYKNIDVNLTINDPVLIGSSINQIKELAAILDIDLILDGKDCIISKRGTARSSERILINESTGLIKYPEFDDVGVVLTTFFNPNILFGGIVKIESEIKSANGEWKVYSLEHNISIYGDFITNIKAHPIGAMR